MFPTFTCFQLSRFHLGSVGHFFLFCVRFYAPYKTTCLVGESCLIGQSGTKKAFSSRYGPAGVCLLRLGASPVVRASANVKEKRTNLEKCQLIQFAKIADLLIWEKSTISTIWNKLAKSFKNRKFVSRNFLISRSANHFA